MYVAHSKIITTHIPVSVVRPSALAEGARSFRERFEAKQDRADEKTFAKEISKIREVYPDWNLPK